MNAMSDMNRFHLLDASALRPHEIDVLAHAASIHWLYDHIKDEQARTAGPVLVGPDQAVDAMAATLKSDEYRAWAIASLQTNADMGSLYRHLSSRCYLHTQDGQRYFLRYADSRCLVALWPVLNHAQQIALMGPIQDWSYVDRAGHQATIRLRNESDHRTAIQAHGALKLSDEQLGRLLERSWPDQLLYALAEQPQSSNEAQTPWQRYACAQRVCDWLIAQQEARYPVQLTLLQHLLTHGKVDWRDDQWEVALREGHAAASESLA